jgi:hypothetical protein
MQKYAYYEKNKDDFNWGALLVALGIVVGIAATIFSLGMAGPIVAAAFIAGGSLGYALMDPRKDGCEYPQVEGEFGHYLDQQCGGNKAERECIGNAFKSTAPKTCQRIIDNYSGNIQYDNRDNWDDIDWPIRSHNGISNSFRIEALREARQTLQNIDNAIKRAEEELKKLQAECEQLRKDYEEACKYLMEQAAKLKNPDLDYSVSTFASGKIWDHLHDLRNINYKNFRGDKPTPEQEKMKTNKMTTDEKLNRAVLGNRQISFSKTFKMNKDFLINDTLSLYKDLEVDEGTSVMGMSSGLVTKPLVQTLILNEFQPYDMVSPADIIPGFANAGIEFAQQGAAMLGGNALIVLGKYAMTKATIDDISLNPNTLYGLGAKKRERKYFTKDPVQTIQNMFNGGKWLNTYEIPFYGREYLESKNKGTWSIGDSKGFLGALAGNDEPGSVGTKRIWY